MARLKPMLFLASLSSIAAAAQAAGPPGISLDQKARPHSNFDIPDQIARFGVSDRTESRIFFGREVMRNGVLGVGLFGRKTEKALHSPVTARDLSIPKSRKASVGFSLKF